MQIFEDIVETQRGHGGERGSAAVPFAIGNITTLTVPTSSRGCWCQVSLDLPYADEGVIPYLVLYGTGRVGEAFLRRSALRRHTSRFVAILFVASDVKQAELQLFGLNQASDWLDVRWTPLSRSVVAINILARHPLRLARTLLGSLASGPRATLHRLRAELALLAGGGPAAGSFPLWVELFDQWSSADHARLLASPRRPDWPSITGFVFCAQPEPNAAAAASRAAIAAGLIQTQTEIIGPTGLPLAKALARTASPYIALIQAGEVLPPHALALLADQAVARGNPAVLYADEDELTEAGLRTNPTFKPEPSRTLMLSGTLSRGVWLVRRDHLAAFTPGADEWAETLRLDAWLRLHEAGRAAESARVPFILTHRRPDTEAAPAAALAAVARGHIERTRLPAEVTEATPLRVRFAAPSSAQPSVSLIVPSTCQGRRVLRCLSTVLATTRYANFEVVVVVSSREPLRSEQERFLTRLERDRRVRRLVYETDRFNFAAANNRAVAATNSPYVCLLNDDVAPLDPDWLAAMMGHLADPEVGIVGARLFYPDRRLQHAGVVLTPDGTGDHVHRFLPRTAAGYAGRARLSQEFSAVTAACLLTRRSVWDQLGGMDTAYASAFNDIDYCLRAREAGWRVVLAAEAELLHYESLSFGQHYAPEEHARAAAERARLLERFPGVFADDPFHNPNLSRRHGDCWSPAFPPRADRFG